MVHIRRVLLSLTWVAVGGFAQPAIPTYLINTAAGGPPPPGNNGPAASVLLRQPEFVAADGAGNLYFSEAWGFTIRKVTSNGTIVTAIGTGVYGSTSDGQQASSGAMGSGSGLTFDASGNLYFVENGNRIRKISASGVLSTVAGTINAGFGGDGGPATVAEFNGIQGITFDQAGNLYVADTANHVIRKVATTGVVTTVAGTGGASGFAGDGGPAASARLNSPNDVAVDTAGNLFIADRNNNRIRIVTPDGNISTFAGTGGLGTAGDGGSATAAPLTQPEGLALDASGNLYVTTGNRVRRITRTGSSAVITLFAGTSAGYAGDGGPAIYAQLWDPLGVTVDAAGKVYIADGNQLIRKVDRTGTITTAAGAGHFAGDNGRASSALLSFPSAVTVDSIGRVFIADSGNNRIRQVGTDGVIRTVAGNGVPGFSGDGGQATAAMLQFPQGVAVDRAGNLFVSDTQNSLVRKIDTAGIITTIAGTGGASSGMDGPATLSPLNAPMGLALDNRGNIYIADSNNNQIRVVNSQGTISTFVGTGAAGGAGDGGSAKAATLNHPQGIAFDSAGNLYIADHNNFRVRRVSPTGVITTFAGTVQGASSGDGGPATSATFGHLSSVAVDASGNVLISDLQNGQIRIVNSAGTIATIAGTGAHTDSGDGGLALQATFGEPEGPPGGLAVGPGGVVYFTDYGNEALRQLTPILPAQLTIVSGNNQSGLAGSMLPGSLVVSVLGATGLPVAGVTVSFAVTTGAATLTANSAVTGVDGKAQVSLTLGNTVGPVSITASATGLTSVVFSLTSTANTGPQISSGGIVGAGLSVPPVTALSPNALVSIFGQNFAAAGSTTLVVGAGDLVGGQVPTQFAGVCVEVNSVRAPVIGVSPGQLNIQVPAIPQSGSVGVQVIANCGQPAEARSPTVQAPAQSAAPEFFFFARNASGQNPVAAVNATSGVYIGTANLISGATFVPARAGDILSIFMTGLGVTNPPYAAGVLPPSSASVAAPLTVSLGSLNLPATNILYAGVAPLNAGLYQLNIQIPSGAPTGNVPLTVTVGTYPTPPGGYLTIGQ